MTPPEITTHLPRNLQFPLNQDNGKYRVAEIEGHGEQDYQVRFVGGGGRTASLDDLRRCSLVPGEQVVCSWPGWGVWTCTIMSYDAESRVVQVTDGWGSTHDVSIGLIWMKEPKPPRLRRTRVYAALIGIGATAGAIIGSLITALVIG